MAKSVDIENIYDNLSLELRRGVMTLAVLSQLQQEQYGYSLKQALAERGMDINEGTLYPLLRRLEKQGLLQSDWRVINDARPRRYYRISAAGEKVLAILKQEWVELVGTIDDLLVAKVEK